MIVFPGWLAMMVPEPKLIPLSSFTCKRQLAAEGETRATDGSAFCISRKRLPNGLSLSVVLLFLATDDLFDGRGGSMVRERGSSAFLLNGN